MSLLLRRMIINELNNNDQIDLDIYNHGTYVGLNPLYRQPGYYDYLAGNHNGTKTQMAVAVNTDKFNWYGSGVFLFLCSGIPVMKTKAWNYVNFKLDIDQYTYYGNACYSAIGMLNSDTCIDDCDIYRMKGKHIYLVNRDRNPVNLINNNNTIMTTQTTVSLNCSDLTNKKSYVPACYNIDTRIRVYSVWLSKKPEGEHVFDGNLIT